MTASTAFSVERELEQGGRVAARHAGNDSVLACHVGLFGQFRRLGTVADGGRQALEIQAGLQFPGRTPARPLHPTKIAGLLTHGSRRCNTTKRPVCPLVPGRNRLHAPPRVGGREAAPNPSLVPSPGNVPACADPSKRDSIDSTARLMLVGAEPRLGPDLAGHEVRARRDAAVQHAGRQPPRSRPRHCSRSRSLQRRNLAVKRGITRLHVVVAGCLERGGFHHFHRFRADRDHDLAGRGATYTMPIWAALLAYPILGERLNRIRGVSLLLCGVGLLILTYPLIGSSDLIGVGLAVGTAVSWAAGTVYLKWARIDADPMAVAAWQLVRGPASSRSRGCCLSKDRCTYGRLAPLPSGRWFFQASSDPASPICCGSRSCGGCPP